MSNVFILNNTANFMTYHKRLKRFYFFYFFFGKNKTTTKKTYENNLSKHGRACLGSHCPSWPGSQEVGTRCSWSHCIHYQHTVMDAGSDGFFCFSFLFSLGPLWIRWSNSHGGRSSHFS